MYQQFYNREQLLIKWWTVPRLSIYIWWMPSMGIIWMALS